MTIEEDPKLFIIEDDLLDLFINEDSNNIFNELTILGSIISDKVLNFKAIKMILLSAWNLGPQVQITALDRNLISYSFSKGQDIVRILNMGPWAVKGHIISFQY